MTPVDQLTDRQLQAEYIQVLAERSSAVKAQDHRVAAAASARSADLSAEINIRYEARAEKRRSRALREMSLGQ